MQQRRKRIDIFQLPAFGKQSRSDNMPVLSQYSRRKCDLSRSVRISFDLETPYIDQKLIRRVQSVNGSQWRMRDVIVFEALDQLCLQKCRNTIGPLNVGESGMIARGREQEL
jgi:hypothetical protein